MPSIQDIPFDLWLDILEYLDIPDLHAFNSIFGGTLHWIIARTARKVVEKFIISAELRVYSYLICPGFQLDSDPNFPRMEGPELCPFYFRGCLSRTFRKNKFGDTEMNYQLACKRCQHWDLLFHPCRNGPEPAQIVYLYSEFLSNEKLADDSRESLRLTYKEKDQTIPIRRDFEVHCDGRTTLTLSHGMPLCQFQWRTSTMRSDIGIDLPREWIGFLNDNIQVLMRFERNPARTHTIRSRPDSQCSVSELKYFKVDWTFHRMCSEIGLPWEADVIKEP